MMIVAVTGDGVLDVGAGGDGEERKAVSAVEVAPAREVDDEVAAHRRHVQPVAAAVVVGQRLACCHRGRACANTSLV